MLKKSIKNELILLGTKGGPAIRPNGSMPSSSLLIFEAFEGPIPAIFVRFSIAIFSIILIIANIRNLK